MEKKESFINIRKHEKSLVQSILEFDFVRQKFSSEKSDHCLRILVVILAKSNKCLRARRRYMAPDTTGLLFYDVDSRMCIYSSA